MLPESYSVLRIDPNRYWTNRGYKGVLGSFKPPTKVVRSTSYNEWRDFAHQADAMGIEAGARHL